MEEIEKNFYKLRNSIPTDPVLRIPKNRKTVAQNFICAFSDEIGIYPQEMEEIFENQAGNEIEWDTGSELILSDEGFSLRFRLKNNPDLGQKNVEKKSVEKNETHNPFRAERRRRLLKR